MRPYGASISIATGSWQSPVQIFYSRLALRNAQSRIFGSQLTAKLVDRRAQWREGNYCCAIFLRFRPSLAFPVSRDHLTEEQPAKGEEIARLDVSHRHT